MIYNLDNIKYHLVSGNNPIIKKRVYGNDTVNQYALQCQVSIELSNKQVVIIPRLYTWDLASVPRFLWGFIPPDSDAELAFLIHDYLYENKIISRKFSDNEMLKWSIVTNGTKKLSLRNIDNYTRYYGVRLFGWIVWNKKK